MNDQNPYAPPPIVAELALPVGKYPLDDAGLWRQGNLLVLRKDARLPPRCVKSNQPAKQSLNRNLVWYPRWVILLVLINLIVFAVVALILQKKATIHIGRTDEWMARRRDRMLIAWGVVLLAVCLFIAGIALVQSYEQVAAAMMILSPFVLIGGMFYGLFAARMVYPKKIDDHFVWLKGVCPEYLADLPEWTGPKA